MAGSPEFSRLPDTDISLEDKSFLRESGLEHRIRNSEDVDAHIFWQRDGDSVMRAIRAQFDRISTGIAGAEPLSAVRSFGLPRTDAFLHAICSFIADPSHKPEDPLVQKMIDRLREAKSKEGVSVDALDVLTNPRVSAVDRWKWWKAEAEGQFDYFINKDRAELRDEKKLVEEIKETIKEDSSFELPPPQQDEMTTGMDELSESKEGEPRGYFSVHPFWGGYYREEVFETHAGGNKWKKKARTHEEVLEQSIGTLEERRVFRGTVYGGAITPLPIPYGFVPELSTLRASGNAHLMRDSEGMWSLDARGSATAVSFTIEIGIPRIKPSKKDETPTRLAIENPTISASAQQIISGLSGNVLDKARALKRHIQQLLEYSNESALNAVYENHVDGYFAAIEEYKKADCDVANAYYINLLSAAGIHARMATGHYVKMKDAHGAALMNSGTRHVWTEVWDPYEKTWVRFDATPPKDPTLDDERPDEQSEDDPGPGDYGEQEARILSEEEFEMLREEIKAMEETVRLKEAPPRVREFVKEVGCTLEEAAMVLQRIEEARRIRDSKGRIIRTTLGKRFTEIVESNFKEVPEWKGPVKRSEGDEADDWVMIGKDVATGSSDPLGYIREETDVELAQEYGGLDLYIAADRSESMNWLDPISGKPKKEEQQKGVFLLMDSLFAFSKKTRLATRQNKLISPLSVRSATLAFQKGSAGYLRKLGSTWGKKEWFEIWKGLESNVGGGTPAHLALSEIRKTIQDDIEKEKRKKPPAKPRVRMVAVFMDGGVDDPEAYLAEQKALEDMGVHVVPYGMTEAARAVAALPNGRCVPSVGDMIEPVTVDIIEQAKKLQARKISKSSQRLRRDSR